MFKQFVLCDLSLLPCDSCKIWLRNEKPRMYFCLHCQPYRRQENSYQPRGFGEGERFGDIRNTRISGNSGKHPRKLSI